MVCPTYSGCGANSVMVTVSGPPVSVQGFFDALRDWSYCLSGIMHFDVGVPRVVGIAVGEKIQAAFARRFDDVDVLGRFSPDGDGAHFDVGMFDGNVRALADGDFFVQRGETFVALVADVRFVKAAMLGGDFGQRRRLLRWSCSWRRRIRGRWTRRERLRSWLFSASATIF